MVHGSGLQARDVVAFGHEIGRALSDGRIVGRAEPFAKVFASSRAVKRAVGLVAWAILEDIALDAHLDDTGRLIATTNVRRIATNLTINKDTAAKHLARLRDYGFVIQEEGGHSPSGRWESCRYILDPSACLERFHPHPHPKQRPAARPARRRRSRRGPRTAVSERSGHGPPSRTPWGARRVRNHRTRSTRTQQQEACSCSRRRTTTTAVYRRHRVAGRARHRPDHRRTADGHASSATDRGGGRRSPGPPDPQPCRVGPHRSRRPLGPDHRRYKRRATADNPTAPAESRPARRDTVSTTVGEHARCGAR
jgi:hypothetical protein